MRRGLIALAALLGCLAIMVVATSPPAMAANYAYDNQIILQQPNDAMASAPTATINSFEQPTWGLPNNYADTAVTGSEGIADATDLAATWNQSGNINTIPAWTQEMDGAASAFTRAASTDSSTCRPNHSPVTVSRSFANATDLAAISDSSDGTLIDYYGDTNDLKSVGNSSAMTALITHYGDSNALKSGVDLALDGSLIEHHYGDANQILHGDQAGMMTANDVAHFKNATNTVHRWTSGLGSSEVLPVDTIRLSSSATILRDDLARRNGRC